MMTPTEFPEVNARFGPPFGYAESQVMPILAYYGMIERGSMEGDAIVVTAWKPTRDEIAQIASGKPIFLTFVGGLPPHYPSMSFQEATNPA
jgi:hypothetical protein